MTTLLLRVLLPCTLLAQDPSTSCEELLARSRAECETLRERVAELERELDRLETERIEREREWLLYTRAIAGLERPVLPEDVTFESVLEEETRAAEEEAAEDRAAREARGHEVFLALRSLFVAEGVEGYDLLASGLVHDGAAGPLVLRLLDELRRPIGSLSAARLRLEGSETAHTLTLVFEEGYERRGGLKVPFEGGTLEDLSTGERRVVLPHVDPRPWMEALPELFERQLAAQPKDDGLWELEAVRARLNELLAEDAAVEFYRLRSLGGVVDATLREVHLEQRDREGRVVRRLFADRMWLEALESGIRVTLRDGAQLRGQEKLPFLDGRYRIFLPAARLDAWRDGRLPGLAPPPELPE